MSAKNKIQIVVIALGILLGGFWLQGSYAREKICSEAIYLGQVYATIGGSVFAGVVVPKMNAWRKINKRWKAMLFWGICLIIVCVCWFWCVIEVKDTRWDVLMTFLIGLVASGFSDALTKV